jgi:hypothetical protein
MVSVGGTKAKARQTEWMKPAKRMRAQASGREV